MPACKRGVVSHASLAVPHRPEYGFSPIDSAQQIGASSPFSLGDPMTAPRICPECQQRTGLARRGYGAGPPRRGRRHHGLPVVRPRVDRRADRPARPSDTNDEVASPPFTFPLVPRPILGRWRFCPPLIAARLALESDHARGLRFDVTERPHARGQIKPVFLMLRLHSGFSHGMPALPQPWPYGSPSQSSQAQPPSQRHSIVSALALPADLTRRARSRALRRSWRSHLIAKSRNCSSHL